MRYLEDFSDERHKAWCIHCGQGLASVAHNDDHVPSKCFLQKPHPPHLPTVRVCKICNEGFSRDEAYVAAFLAAVVCGSTDPARQARHAAKRILAQSAKLRERIERAKTEYRTEGGDLRLMWAPELPRFERVAVKNARGHAFFELGEPVLHEPDTVRLTPLLALSQTERHDFEAVQITSVWPEVGSRMMSRIPTGDDLVGRWVMVQEGNYRYWIGHGDGITVRSIVFDYLAVEVRWS